MASQEPNPIYKLRSSTGLAPPLGQRKWITLGRARQSESRAMSSRIVAEHGHRASRVPRQIGRSCRDMASRNGGEIVVFDN